MMEKLKELGLDQNVTVRWRDQAGGDTFYKMRDEMINMMTCEHFFF